MHPPRSVTLYLDESNNLRHSVTNQTDIGGYLNSMRTIQERTGKPPRAALENFTPIFVSSAAGTLTVAPVSGVPHHLNADYQPIMLNDAEGALFLKRGDHYVLRTDLDKEWHQAFLFVTYDICPKVVIAPKPVVQRNPVDDPVADHDASRLLQIVQARELAPVEQFFAAYTLPHVWKRHGGMAVPVITNPTQSDIKTCREFALNFTMADQKLSALASAWPDWAAALRPAAPADTIAPPPAAVGEEAHVETAEESYTPSRPRFRM